MRWRCSCQTMLFPFLVAVAFLLKHSDAAVYTYYGFGSLEERFESTPADFGQPWVKEMFYEAELFFDEKNPSLCNNHTLQKDDIDDIVPTFLRKNRQVVFLAEEGGCSIQQKIRNAKESKAAVNFMLIYKRDLDHQQQSVNVEEYNTSSSMRFMTISWETARSLIAYYNNMGNHGTWIAMKWDAVTILEDHYYDIDDYFDLDTIGSNTDDDIGDPSLGLFFVLVFLSAFFFLFAAANQQRHISRQRHNHETSMRPELNGFVGRNLITQSDVDRYLATKVQRTRLQYKDDDTAKEKADERKELVALQCAICIEDFDSNGEKEHQNDRLTLPCGHTFHTDCIQPWLTERQGTCPLCKFDVYQYVQEAAALDFSLPTEWVNAFGIARLRVKSFIDLPSWSGTSSTTTETVPSASVRELELSISRVSSLSSLSQEDDVLSSP